MNQVVVKQRNDIALRKVTDDISASLVEALNSFVDCPITMSPAGDLQCVDLGEWRESWSDSRSVIRGTLAGMDDEHSLVIVLDTADTITLCGHLMLVSTEVIRANREEMVFGVEQQEAFSELGNLLCSTISSAVRRQFDPQSGMQIRDFATLPVDETSCSSLGYGARLVYSFNLQIGDLPTTQLHLVIDHEIGQAWNDEIPLFVFDFESVEGTTTPSGGAPQSATRRTKLSAFVTSLETASMIRDCGRKLGMEVQRYSRTDVPNPAAHTSDVVLVEIPVGEEKRFDWAKRLRQYHRDIPVVLLIHEPSRPRVVQALLTRANVILAWPSKAAQLRAKIEPLVEIDSDDDVS